MAAQGRTYLQIVNEVLPRLREDTVAAVTTTAYSTLIGKIVNQVAAEMQDAWHWYAMRDTFSVTTVIGTSQYGLTGSNPGAVVLDGWNVTTQGQMKQGTNASFNKRFFGQTTVDSNSPTEYIQNGVTADYDAKIDVWPNPSAVQTLKFTVYVPQDDLSAGTDVSLLPQSVLIEGTMARALRERGDDGGTAADVQDVIYRDMLASAIAREAAVDPTEVDWIPV